MNSDDRSTSRGRSFSASCSDAWPSEPLTQERLLEISDGCRLDFQPMTDEPLEDQRRRLLFILESRISFLLSLLLELEPFAHDDGGDDV